jgi:polyisoprenoid-binding protein YceI
MIKLLAVCVGLLAAASASAQQKLLPAQSEIAFVAKQMGVPLDGKFGKFDAQVTFDTRKPEAGKIAFTIDLGSAVVGDADTVKELKKPDWFSVVKFPNATFASSAIKATGPGKFEVVGSLSIKGNVKPVTIPVTVAPAAAGVSIAQGSFLLKRVDFKIGEGDWSDFSIVANEVTVRFKLALTGL